MTAAPQIVEVGRADLQQAAEVLTRALTPYPTMRWVCRSEEPGFERRLRAVYDLALAMQRAERQPTLGLLEDGRLVAVAIVHDPGRRLTLRSALGGLFGGLLSPARSTMARGHGYETAISRERPREPHHFLSVIGVEPKQQRRGYGRVLMDSIHARADRDPASSGVCLDTCDASNRSYYENLGYEVLSSCITGPLSQWIMFRRRRTGHCTKSGLRHPGGARRSSGGSRRET
jgi:GNAT superfamily N-acetyltransferase